MRVKQLWAVIPLPSKLRLVYSRVTLNPPTTVFFILALVQCIFQISLHLWLYTRHQYASQNLEAVALNPTIITLPLAIQMGGDIFLCKDIPAFVGGPDQCTKAPISTSATKRSLSATPLFNGSGELLNVTLVDSNTLSRTVVPKQCVDVLPWVFQSLRAINREDLAFFVYHVWLFGVSLTAILNESIPHLIAALALQVLCVIGSAFRIMATSYFQSEFKHIVVDGSCNGDDLLGASYFESRRRMEVVIFALNAAAMVGFTGLSWRLIKTYGQRSFERVHKRPEMNRLYIVTLTMCSCIQVAVFYMVAALSLVIDQLTLGPLRNLVQLKPLHLAISIALIVLVVPWMILGWTFGRMESKPRALMFLALTIMFIATWGTMFTSQVHRLLIMTWGFFAMTSITPLVLIFATLLLALYAWFHLDLGLAEYLKAEELDPADKVRWSLAVTSDPEKGNPSLLKDGSGKPLVTWVHLPSPVIVKPLTVAQNTARSHLNAWASTKGNKGIQKTSGSGSGSGPKPLTKTPSVPSGPDPYPPPPPGLVPPVATDAKEAPAAQKIFDIARVPPPPPTVARSLPTLLEAAASDCVRHRFGGVGDDCPISTRSSVEARPLRLVTTQPVNGRPSGSGIRPTLKNRL